AVDMDSWSVTSFACLACTLAMPQPRKDVLHKATLPIVCCRNTTNRPNFPQHHFDAIFSIAFFRPPLCSWQETFGHLSRWFAMLRRTQCCPERSTRPHQCDYPECGTA